MKAAIITLLTVFMLCSNAFAADDNFEIVSKQPLPNEIGTFQQIKFKNNNSDDPTIFYAAIFNQNYHAKVFQQDGKIQFFANYLDTLSQQQDFIVATNGGFYRPDFTPAGLFIDKGKVVHSVVHDGLLKTCIAINKKEKMSLETHVDACSHAFYAMQTGPLLVSNGKINEEVEALEQRFAHMKDFFLPHKRTVLASAENGTIIAITTSSTTLSDIAKILQDFPQAFGVNKIKIAIDLDGGSSTGMYVRFADQPFYYPEFKHVKTFVFFK